MDKVWILVLLVLLAVPASATFIRISTTIAAEQIIRESRAWVNVTLENSGDEPAYNTRLQAILPEGFRSEPAYVGTLSPYKPIESSFNITVDEGTQNGTYPLILKVEYTDANGYPFSTLSPRIIVYHTPTPMKVYARVQNIAVAENKKANATILLRNMDSREHDINVRVYLPNELKTDREQMSVVLGGRSEEEMRFEVESFGALPNSTYVVTVSADFEEDNVRHTVLGGGMVTILSKDSLQDAESGKQNFMLWALIATFFLLIAAFLILRRR
ncbi:MAG: NEW3 domain-containing protein [Candidatus Altiarchaeota archaeon]